MQRHAGNASVDNEALIFENFRHHVGIFLLLLPYLFDGELGRHYSCFDPSELYSSILAATVVPPNLKVVGPAAPIQRVQPRRVTHPVHATAASNGHHVQCEGAGGWSTSSKNVRRKCRRNKCPSLYTFTTNASPVRL